MCVCIFACILYVGGLITFFISLNFFFAFIPFLNMFRPILYRVSGLIVSCDEQLNLLEVEGILLIFSSLKSY